MFSVLIARNKCEMSRLQNLINDVMFDQSLTTRRVGNDSFKMRTYSDSYGCVQHSDGCWTCSTSKLLRSSPDEYSTATGAASNLNVKPPLQCYWSHSQRGEFTHSHGQFIDNGAYVLHKMALLFRGGDLSDVILVVGQHTFAAHRLVLCSASDVFRVMLSSSHWFDSRQQTIALQEEEECVDVFENFLFYIYTGFIELCNASVLPVLILADKYNVMDLRELCLSYMKEHLASIAEQSHIIDWLQYAKCVGYKQFVRDCQDFILCNFSRVAVSEDFLLIDCNLLCELLSSDYLVVESEYSLFVLVSRWLEHLKVEMDDDTQQWTQHIALPVLSCLRYFMMHRQQIEAISQLPSFVTFRDFFAAQLDLWKHYHSDIVSCSLPTDGFNVNRDIRIYTSDAWSTSLVVDNYRDFRANETKTVFFASPLSASKACEQQSWEWQVDFYPKGVHYDRSYLISWLRKLELSGADYPITRVVLQSRPAETRNVDVVLLVIGMQDGVEYVKKCVLRRCSFSERSPVEVFNDIIPYEELNGLSGSRFLCGHDANTLKVHIVIKPV